MKPSSIPSLLLVSALLLPSLHAQDEPTKVREIEQKVLRKQYRTGIDALAGSAHGDKPANPEAISKRLQWLTLVATRIEGENKTPAANPQEMTKNADALNDLAWNMITSADAGKRFPETALKLADIALELCGENADLKPNILDTKARALFLLGRHREAIAEQEKAIAAEVFAEEKAGFEATLALYQKKELPEIRPESAEPLTGTAYIMNKLKTIVIPRIDFEDTSVEEAIEFLRLRAAELDVTELDPSKKGVDFVIRRPRPGAAEAEDAASDPGTLRIKELRIRTVPLAVALKYICDQTKLRYKVDDFAVTLVPLSEVDKELFTRTFRVPLDFATQLNSVQAPADPAERTPIIELLKSNGINFGEGSSATLTANGMLMITNTPTEIDKLEQLIAATMPDGQ